MPKVSVEDVAKAALKAVPINQAWLDALATWIMDGLGLFYRDSELTSGQLEQYQVGGTLRSPIFVDVSPTERPQTTNCRYAIASSKAAPLFEVNPDVGKWKLHTLGCNSYFKVLDIQKVGGQTQILLLHIPAQGVRHLRNNAVSTLNFRTDLKALKKQAQISFSQQKTLPPNPVFQDPEWVDRTSIPIGLEPDDSLSPMKATRLLHPQASALLDAIRKMTYDNSLNIVPELES